MSSVGYPECVDSLVLAHSTHHVHSTLFIIPVMLYAYLMLQLQDQNYNTVIIQQDRAPPHLKTEVCAYFDKRIGCAKSTPWLSLFSYLAHLHLNYVQVHPMSAVLC